MDSMTAIQLAREIDELRNELKELKKQLEPVFKREEEFQFEAEMDRKHPCGWGYIDPNDHSKGVWSVSQSHQQKSIRP